MAAFVLSVIVNEYPIGQVSFSCFDYFAYHEPESQIIIICIGQICICNSTCTYMLCQQIISFNPLFSLMYVYFSLHFSKEFFRHHSYGINHK